VGLGQQLLRQLGDGTNRNSSIPVRVTGLTGVVAIDTGGSDSGGCSLALKSDGTVWGWGENKDGQLCHRYQAGQQRPCQDRWPV